MWIQFSSLVKQTRFLVESRNPGSIDSEHTCALPTYPLLVIRNDAANEVGVGVSESCHQLGERLFVELPDGSEHALLGFIRRAKSCLSHTSDLIQTYNSVHWGKERRGEEERERL